MVCLNHNTRRPIAEPHRAAMSPAELAEGEAAARQIVDTLSRVAELYLDACRAGAPQADVFEITRRAFERCWGLPAERAANWARIVIAFVGSNVGERVYTRADFEIIVAKALGGEV